VPIARALRPAIRAAGARIVEVGIQTNTPAPVSGALEGLEVGGRVGRIRRSRDSYWRRQPDPDKHGAGGRVSPRWAEEADLTVIRRHAAAAICSPKAHLTRLHSPRGRRARRLQAAARAFRGPAGKGAFCAARRSWWCRPSSQQLDMDILIETWDGRPPGWIDGTSVTGFCNFHGHRPRAGPSGQGNANP